MTTPYTYRIKHNPTGTWYYGVRYANGCHPDDLFKVYFTSSTKVRKLIKQDGLHSFTPEIRKTFSTKEEAIKWEFRVLRRVLYFKTCLNESAFPAVSPRANKKALEKLRQIGEDGLNHYQRNGIKWKQKQDTVDPITGLTFREIRKQKYHQSLIKNGTQRKGRASPKTQGDKNPSKRQEVREKISNTLKRKIASGEIVQWPTGKKLEYVSKMMKGNKLVEGMEWFNDGTRDYRLLPTDERTAGLNKGRLFSAIRGKNYEPVTCPHCGLNGAGGNMKRYHFANCKSFKKDES